MLRGNLPTKKPRANTVLYMSEPLLPSKGRNRRGRRRQVELPPSSEPTQSQATTINDLETPDSKLQGDPTSLAEKRPSNAVVAMKQADQGRDPQPRRVHPHPPPPAHDAAWVDVSGVIYASVSFVVSTLLDVLHFALILVKKPLSVLAISSSHVVPPLNDPYANVERSSSWYTSYYSSSPTSHLHSKLSFVQFALHPSYLILSPCAIHSPPHHLFSALPTIPNSLNCRTISKGSWRVLLVPAWRWT